MSESDIAFTGSVPELYTRCMGPVFFEPYAEELARRLAGLTGGAVLETACGTGIVTRALRRALPARVGIAATDLNQAMLDYARGLPGGEGITWQQADAQALPFPDQAFDALVCSFGAMFFPDKPRAYAEARRVLRPGGLFLFTLWDRLEANELSLLAHDAVAALYPADPPGFYRRTPFGHHDAGTVRADLAQAGFADAMIETHRLVSRAASARDAAIGLIRGTPLSAEIIARDPAGLDGAVTAAAAAIAACLGDGPVEAPMQALVVTAHRPAG